MDKRNRELNDGFIMDWCEKIFERLSEISVFFWVRKFKKNMSYTFVEGWVIGNLIISILSTVIVYNSTLNKKVYIYTIAVYAVIRVFEIIVYQLNVMLFDQYRAQKNNKEYKVKSVPRMVILLLHNYIEIMFWYSSMVISLVILTEGNPYNLTWGEYIRSNMLCIATLDGDSIKAVIKSSSPYLSSLVFLEIMSGIIMTIISLARFIGMLPAVDEIDSNNNNYQYKEIKTTHDEVAASSVIKNEEKLRNKYFDERRYNRINRRKRMRRKIIKQSDYRRTKC